MKKNTIIKTLTVTVGIVGIVVMGFAINEKFKKQPITEPPIIIEPEVKEEVQVEIEVPKIEVEEPTIPKEEKTSEEIIEDIVVEKEQEKNNCEESSEKKEEPPKAEEVPEVTIEPIEPDVPNDLDRTPPAPEPPKEPPKDGEVYVPGFGYVKSSGENTEIVVDDMYENGNKIGEMG